MKHIPLREKYRRSGIGLLLWFIRDRCKVPGDFSRLGFLERNMIGF
jgi:hypothetical protein